MTFYFNPFIMELNLYFVLLPKQALKLGFNALDYFPTLRLISNKMDEKKIKYKKKIILSAQIKHFKH